MLTAKRTVNFSNVCNFWATL